MAYNSKTQTFDTSSELRNRVGKDGASVFVLGYYVAGDFGQTLIYTYSSSAVADDDGGIVFKPDTIDSGDPGRWLLSYSQPVNVLWFGLKAGGSGFDNLALFNAMISALPNIPTTPIIGYNSKGKIYFPRNESSYYFSGTIEILDLLNICGDESIDLSCGTILEFPTDTIGLHIRPSVGGVRGAYGFTANNFKVQSTIGSLRTTPGIVISRPSHLDCIDVTGFSGGGISIDTTIEGIADLCYLVNCSTYYNAESGLTTKGVDSNQCTIINLNSFGNLRWGVDEQGFLGNTYVSCHTNVNTNVPGNPVWAFLSGVTYACIQNHTNKQPGVAADWRDYWVIVVTGIVAPVPEFPAWSSSFAYKTGGAYNSYEAVSNASVWVNCYSEGGQPPSARGQYNLRIGGVDGATERVKSANMAAANAKLISTSGIRVVVPTDYYTPAEQEVSIDELGFNIYPSNSGVLGTGISLQWVNSLKVFASIYNNTTGSSTYWITTSQMDASYLGRVTTPEALPYFVRGMLLGTNDDYPRGRMIEFSNAAPSVGYHAIGDIAFKRVTGADDPILGWRCTVAGTPGTWEEMVSGATVNVVDGTPTNTVTPTGWFKTSIEGVDAWLPYYQ